MEDSAKHLPTALLTGTQSCSGADADIPPSQMSPANEDSRFTKKKENIQDSYDHFVPGQQAQNPSHKRGRKWGKRGKVELKLAQKDAALARSLQLSGPRKWQFKRETVF